MQPTPNMSPKLYADQIGDATRSRADEVFFLSVEAYPEPGAPDFGNTGGAYVHCYLDTDDLRSAELKMIELLREHGWRPHRLEGWEITCPECADQAASEDGAPTQLDAVNEALEDGSALVFYCWDLDALDAIPSDSLG